MDHLEVDKNPIETENGDEVEGDENHIETENADEVERKEDNINPNINEVNEVLVERYEYEIEESVADFIDEVSIERHTIPESSDEDEDEDEFGLRDRRARRRRDDKLALGSAFYTGYEFKEVVLEYALRKPRNIQQDRWDKTKISYKCGIGGKCKWRIYCAYDKRSQKWLVKTKYGYHSCTPNGKCKLLKGPVIARLFLDKLRVDADLMPEKIQELIKENWKIVSTRNQCQNGRLLALKWLEREYADQFAHLHGYAQEIRTTNPGSTAIVETTPNAAGEDVFKRFYVCFANLRNAWRASCRPIIGLDGTFLKVAVKGVLLTAVGHDANNQIYPIAWAVVQGENADNWLWFIKLLKINLSLQDGNGFVMISDRSKGLISAVKAELPNAEHRMCVKHIVENLKKHHANKDLLKPLVWNLAWSYTPTEYEENRQKLREYNTTLYEDVMKEQPKTWSLAFYKLGSFCEDVDNNSTESFNSTLTKARAKAMVPMLETIRRQAMERIIKRQKKSSRHEGTCSKYVVKMLASEKEDAEKCKIYPLSHGAYEAYLYGNSYKVNTRSKTCDCGKWQITGILCEHAYGAMLDVGLNAEDYVCEWFLTSKWQENYNTHIETVRGPRFWMNSDFGLITAPPEPVLPGRKKKKKKKKFPRIKGKFESPIKKKNKKQVQKLGRTGGIIHCSKCGGEGHNAAGCKVHPKKKMKKTQETIEAASSAQQADSSTSGYDLTHTTVSN